MSAARALGLPPGFVFKPDADDLLKLYLLPRACGQGAAIAGVIVDDEATGAAVPPWEVLARHGRTEDDEAYFFERISEEDGKNRSCGSSWKWVSQRRTPDKVLRLPGGEKISWNKRALNLHEGPERSGSTGWVMHEYTITSPPCPVPVKLCHVAFTGHGRKRQRLPRDVDADQPNCAAAAESSSSEASTTTFLDQELFLPLGQDQELLLSLGQDQERFLNVQQPHDFNQEQIQSCEGSSSVVTSWGSDVGSSQETGPMQQELAFNQQQSQDHLYDAYGALLASGIGAIQEAPAEQPLTHEQLFRQQLDHFLGIPANAETAYHEEHIQMKGTSPKEEPLIEHGSPLPWDNLDVFCDVSQVED